MNIRILFKHIWKNFIHLTEREIPPTSDYLFTCPECKSKGHLKRMLKNEKNSIIEKLEEIRCGLIDIEILIEKNIKQNNKILLSDNSAKKIALAILNADITKWQEDFKENVAREMFNVKK